MGLGAERWSQRTADLARIMNRKSDTDTAWVRRCIERRMEEPEFVQAYVELDEALAAADSMDTIHCAIRGRSLLMVTCLRAVKIEAVGHAMQGHRPSSLPE